MPVSPHRGGGGGEDGPFPQLKKKHRKIREKEKKKTMRIKDRKKGER